MTERSARPMSRWISEERPSSWPRETSRCLRESVAYGSMLYSADGVPILDLNYPEDRDATVDFNVVMTESQAFVEVQGSGEEAVFSAEQMASMLELAKKGVSELITKQKAAILAADKAGPADLASLAQLFG
jgi:hypothetical protein